MGSLLIVTGPPGAGKSTVAAELAARVSPSVMVAGDTFFGFLASGALPPWHPESHAQNEIVTQTIALAAGRFAASFHTILDGVIGPWFLPVFGRTAGLTAFDYVVLLPPVEMCVQRVAARADHAFRDEAATRRMHDDFSAGTIAARHVLTTVDGAAGLADAVDAARRAGTLIYHVER